MPKANSESDSLKVDFFPPDIRKDIEQVETTLKQITAEQPPLGDALHHILIQCKGKRLRPLVLVLAGRCQHSITPQVQWNEQNLITAAVSIELLHTATLIHDDVIDESTIRRGNPSINALWGDDFAILLADFSYAQSLKFALKAKNFEALSIFTQTAINIAKSEILTRTPFSLVEPVDFTYLTKNYYDIIDWRTAGLFAACCQIGALLAGGNKGQIHRLSTFGLSLGRSFQIIDDILDFVGNEKEIGKPIGSDLRNGVLTLPTILALKNVDSGSELWQMVGKSSLHSSQVLEGLKCVKEAGGIRLAYTEAQKWIDKAKQMLQGLPGSGYRTALETLADYTIQRLG